MLQAQRRSFEVGDLVEILPAYRDPGDESLTWRVVAAEEKGRVDISPTDTGLHILPRYVVDVDWIEHAAQPESVDGR